MYKTHENQQNTCIIHNKKYATNIKECIKNIKKLKMSEDFKHLY